MSKAVIRDARAPSWLNMVSVTSSQRVILLGENLEFISHATLAPVGSAAHGALSGIGVDELPKSHLFEFFPAVAGNLLRGLVYIAAVGSLLDKGRGGKGLGQGAELGLAFLKRLFGVFALAAQALFVEGLRGYGQTFQTAL